MKKRSLLFIPAYNEASSISVVLQQALDSHILDLITIVDDASQDNTIETVKWIIWDCKNIQICANTTNRWKSYWFVQAFEECLNWGIDYLFMCDADLLESKVDIFQTLFDNMGWGIMSVLPCYEWSINWIQPNSSELSGCRVLDVKKFDTLLKTMGKSKYLDIIRNSRFWLEVLLNHIVGNVVWLKWPKLSYIKLDEPNLYPLFRSPYKWSDKNRKAQVDEITKTLWYLNGL